MKIRKLDLVDGSFIVGNKEKDNLITEIKEGTHERKEMPFMFGFAIYSDNKCIAWVPYHAVTTIRFEVENES